MKKTILIILAVFVIIGIYLVGSYNHFIGMKQDVTSKWAQVENQLQRRFDLVPNLVETVKGLTKQEQTVFGEIADARTRYAGAQTQSDKVAAANQFESSIGRLLVITENYPTLESSKLFSDLMIQLEGTENRISVERKNYNDTVQVYDTALQRFPGGVVGRMFGFAPAEYFQVSSEAKQNPQVKF
ncbi:MAG: LemA family protein [bacterium]